MLQTAQSVPDNRERMGWLTVDSMCVYYTTLTTAGGQWGEYLQKPTDSYKNRERGDPPRSTPRLILLLRYIVESLPQTAKAREQPA